MVERKRIRVRGPAEPVLEVPEQAPIRPNATLAEFAREWLKTRDKRTQQADTQRLRDHFLSLLGSRRLREIRTDDVTQAVRHMLAKKGMNLKSARNAHGVFVELLGDALARGLLNEDPRNIPPDVWPAEEAAPRPRFSPAEVLALTRSERLDADQRVFNLLAFYSGLGSREICQLQFADWSERVRAPLASELAAGLSDWRARGFEAVYGRPPSEEDWLVPRRSDPTQPHTEGSSYKAFRRACVTLGIKTRSPQAVQNTFEPLTEPSSEPTSGSAPPDHVRG